MKTDLQKDIQEILSKEGLDYRVNPETEMTELNPASLVDFFTKDLEQYEGSPEAGIPGTQAFLCPVVAWGNEPADVLPTPLPGFPFIQIKDIFTLASGDGSDIFDDDRSDEQKSETLLNNETCQTYFYCQGLSNRLKTIESIKNVFSSINAAGRTPSHQVDIHVDGGIHELTIVMPEILKTITEFSFKHPSFQVFACREGISPFNDNNRVISFGVYKNPNVKDRCDCFDNF